MKETKSENMLTKTWIVCLGAMVCCLLWGSAFPCVKIGYQMFGIASDAVATQILFAGTRFAIAGVMVIVIGSLARRKFLHPKRSSVPKVLWLSMLQTVGQYVLFYIGLAHTSGVKASIIEGMNVFVAILVASLLFRQEALTMRKIIGCIIGFIGVVSVNLSGGGFDASLSFFGEGFIFLSTVAYAFSSVFMKRYAANEDPLALSGYQFLVGGIIMAIAGAAGGGSLSGFTFASTTMLIYLALISAVAYSLWSILLKYNPVSKVAVFGFMNPVFGVILSAVLLTESDSLGLACIIALVLVCIGIYITNKEKV